MLAKETDTNDERYSAACRHAILLRPTNFERHEYDFVYLKYSGDAFGLIPYQIYFILFIYLFIYNDILVQHK